MKSLFHISWNRGFMFGIQWIPRHTGVGYPRDEFYFYLGPCQFNFYVFLEEIK